MALFKRSKQLKAIFKLDVDFYDEFKKNNGELEEGKYYYFPRLNSDERKTSYDEIKNYIVKKIEDDFKTHLNKTVGIEIDEIKVTGEYGGSIVLIIVILFNVFQFIAGLKDFYDNLKFIERTITRFLYGKLNKRYGGVFSLRTDIEYPGVDRIYLDDPFMGKYFRKYGLFSMGTQGKVSRDSFFIYLLISNIILLAIIIILVYKAVVGYYNM